MPRVDTASGVDHLCPVCGQSVPVFGRGPGGRANASCPHCGSLERHRLVAFVVRGAAPLLAGASALQIGPAGAITPVLTGPTPHLVVHTLDAGEPSDQLSDDSSGRLPFADDSFDLAVGTQIFDAALQDDMAPDGRARDGMAGELARVLRPGGVAVLYDSADVSAHLEAAGLSVRRLKVADLAGPDVVGLLGLAPGDAVAVARAGVDESGADESGAVESGVGRSGAVESGVVESGPADSGSGRQVLGEWLGAALVATEQARAAAATENEILQSRLTALEASLRRRAERAERAASAAQNRYDSLRARLPLRVANAVLDRAAALRPGTRGAPPH